MKEIIAQVIGRLRGRPPTSRLLPLLECGAKCPSMCHALLSSVGLDMTAVLALLASALWGLSDFMGGSATRRIAARDVILVSQGVEIVFLLPAGLAFGVGQPSAWLYGAAAGVCSVLALQAFYRALAGGTMGVVAPIAALSAVVPAGVGLACGYVPSGPQSVGMTLALGGTALAAGPQRTGGTTARSIVLAAISAIGFGGVNVFLAAASQHSVAGGLIVMRLASVCLLASVRVVTRPGCWRLAKSDLLLLAVIGTADLAANALYAIATTTGLLAVAAVLASLYPAVTALLARKFLGERLKAIQWTGVTVVLVGVAVVAGGSAG